MKFSLISLGCSKNLVDSENYIGMLVNKKNFTYTDNYEDANLILVNTCGFIGDAKIESINTILEVAEYKNQNLKKIVVSGCLAERYADDILKELPEVDAVIGTGEVDKIESIVDEIMQDKKVVQTGSFEYLPTADTERILTTPPHSAYLKIAEGCARRCTYCIIPQLRGTLRSRTIEDIVREAKNLVANGVRELNILAQETTEYGVDIYKKKALPDSLRELVKIEDLKWIRLYYMFPNSITDELLEVIRTEEKICKYFDIPIQHVSDDILRRMARGINGERTKALLYKIKNMLPEATFRTSLIVGFPGETEEQFEELLNFVEEFKFDYIGAFKYSREEDTIAYAMENQIDEDEKHRRWTKLTNLQSSIVDEKNRKMIGKEVEMIIDGLSSESEYMLEGRTRGQALDIDGKILTSEGTAKQGEIVKARLTQSFDYDFIAEIVENEKI